MKFLKSTIVTFFSNVLIFAISILATFLTARILAPKGNGLLAYSNTIVQFSVIILGIGMASSNVFFIGKDKKNISDIIGINIIITVLSFFILIFAYLLNLKFHFYIFKKFDSNLLILIFLIVPFANLKGFFIQILLGLQEIGDYNKLNVLDNILTFVNLTIFIFIFKTTFWVLISNLITIIIVLLIVIYVLIKKYKFTVSFKLGTFLSMLRYGFKFQIGNAIQVLNYRLDVLVVGNYCSLTQVGLYAIAVRLGETVFKVSGSIATIIYPTTTNSKDKLDMKDFINKVTRITFFIISICSILLVIFSRLIIVILAGPAYLNAVGALVLIIPGITVFSISNVLSSYIAGLGKVEKNIIASTLSCAVTLILDFTLIPRIGIMGAAIASSISYTVFTITIIVFYIEITESNLLDVILIKKSDLMEMKIVLQGFLNKIKSRKN